MRAILAGVIAIAVVAITGCAAPPLGLGSGAHRLAAIDGQVTTAFSAGAGDGRQAAQFDGSIAYRETEHVTFEWGVAATQVVAHKDARSLAVLGVLPYFRSRWKYDGMSLALSGSMFGGSGGEEGIEGAFADAQIGYGGDTWSIYTGGYGMGFGNTSGAQTAAAQGRVGGEKLWTTPGGRLGLAVELYLQTDYLGGYMVDAVRSTFAGAALKLRMETGGSGWR